jgi:predicted PurR-regulated permease PerM
MLGLDRKAARYTWTAVAVLLTVELVYVLRSTLFVFAVALLFAYLLSPLVNLLDRALPAQRTRGLALALSYILLISVTAAVTVQIGSRVVEQAETLSKKFPEMVARWESSGERTPEEAGSLKTQIFDNIRGEIIRRANDAVHLLPAAGVRLMSLASNLIFLIIIPVVAFFFLKDSETMRAHILGLVDAGPWRTRLDSILSDAHRLLAHYMRALVLLSIATFVAYSSFFLMIGVPFGVLLAVIAMFLEFIPMIGPLSAGVTIVLVSAVSGSHVVAVIAFLIVYRMFQDYVLSPYLMGQGVELHPLLVLFGVFAGAEVAGVAGSFLSVPVLALVRIIYLHMRRSKLTTRAGEPTQLVS